MKIKEIKQEGNIFQVILSPNWLQRLFGIKEKTVKYSNLTGNMYLEGGGYVYIREDGKKLDNGNSIGEAIDNWRRKF